MYRGLQSEVAAHVASNAAENRPIPISMDVEFAQISDLGKVRQGNEDYLGYVLPATPEEARARGWLFALADGVGGHEHGEIASRTAIESLLAGFRESKPGEPHTTLLARLIQSANADVLDAGHAMGTGGTSMATTIVACALRYYRATGAHVGDLPWYLMLR